MNRFERWLEVKAIVEKALEIPPEERGAFLDHACGTDEDLRREVEALLHAPALPTSSLGNLLGLPDHAEDADYAEGDVIDHFTIVRRIGPGGMGVVYEARDTRNNNRTVALKVLFSRAVKYSQDKRVANLNHPSIVTFHDSGETPESLPYFVFEYIEGEPITTFCEHRNLSITDRLNLFQKVCEAVSYAHDRGLIHCDLKPENILVTATGALKLLDFGIAKQVGEEVSPEDSLPLTLPFASPEQVGGEETTVRSDVYSLGVLLSVLLSGSLPYRNTNSVAGLREAILHVRPLLPSVTVQLDVPADRLCSPPPTKQPSQLADALQGDLDAIVSKALRKDPKERPSSVQELSANIKAYLEKRPVPARQGGWIYQVDRYTRRHRLGAALTVLSLVGVITFAAVWVHQYNLTLRERDAAQAAARQSKQLSTFLISIFELGDPFRHLSTPPTLNELLAESVRQLRSGRFNLAADRALFSETLAGIYSSQGDFKMSLSLYKDALAEVPPGDTAKKASILTQIASAHVDLGQLPEARRELGKAWDLQKSAPSVLPVDAAQWSIVSARERAISGGFREATNHYSKALSLIANLPNEQETVGLIQQERSLPLLLLGRSDDALKTADRALEVGRHLYHSEHPALAKMLMTRAKIFTIIGRYEEAEKDLEDAERALISTFGPMHPSISDVLEDRGSLAIEQQHFDQAIAHFRQVFDLRTRMLGPTHIETLRAYQNIGEAIQGKGDLPTAEVMQRKALHDFERFGRGRVYSVGLLLNNLGLLLIQRGNLSESRLMLERALQVREEMHGEKSAWVAVTKGNLSNLYSQLGDDDKARQELLEAIDLLKASFGPQHHYVATGLNNLGTMYKNKRDYASAIKLYREALSILRADGLDESILATYFLTNLGESLLETGKLEEANRLIQKAQRILRTSADPALPQRDVANGVEGKYLLLRRSFPEAELKLKSSYEGLRQKTGPTSRHTNAALTDLIRLYEVWGRHDLAAKYKQLQAQQPSGK